MRSIYDHFGFELDNDTEAAMKDELTSSPKAKWGVHRYSLDDFAIDGPRLSEGLDWYYKRFDVPRSKTSSHR